MRSEHLLPASIIGGAVVIGLGLYLGLRAQGRGAPAPSVPSAASIAPVIAPLTTMPSAPVGAPVTPASATVKVEAAPTLTPEVTTSSNERVARAALAELEKQRPSFVKACFGGKKPTTPPVYVNVTIAFDKDGREQLRGIVPRTADARLETVDCLRGVEGPISIPATGAPVTVEVPLTLP